MKRVRHSDRDRLGEALKGFTLLDRASLAERWGSFFGASPPPGTSRSLMIRAVAYKMQERAFGGLKASTRRKLLGDSGNGREAASRSHKVSPGTLLLREWQGVTHQVTVIEDGIVYRGKRYRSLSEVARVITGSHWSGPRFFGLKAKT
jgi:hypothetical protein